MFDLALALEETGKRIVMIGDIEPRKNQAGVLRACRHIAAAHPDRWAAIVPICGGGSVKDAEKIKDVPTWVFHGDADAAVKVDRSREMVEALRRAGGKPKYDEYPGVPHNSWDKAYGTDELYKWLLEQKKK